MTWLWGKGRSNFYPAYELEIWKYLWANFLLVNLHFFKLAFDRESRSTHYPNQAIIGSPAVFLTSSFFINVYNFTWFNKKPCLCTIYSRNVFRGLNEWYCTSFAGEYHQQVTTSKSQIFRTWTSSFWPNSKQLYWVFSILLIISQSIIVFLSLSHSTLLCLTVLQKTIEVLYSNPSY